MGLRLEIIAGIQIAIAGIAFTAFYKFVGMFSGQKTALVGSVLKAGFIPHQQWNLYLFADSLFISLFLSVFSRPRALLFNIPTVVFFSGKTKQRKLLANRILTRGEGMILMLPFIEEYIICFVPGFPGGNP